MEINHEDSANMPFEGAKLQHIYLEFLVQEPELLQLFRKYIKTYVFNKPYSSVLKYVYSCLDEHGTIPSLDNIADNTTVRLMGMEYEPAHLEWFKEEFANFLSRKRLDKLLVKQQQKLGEDIEKFIKRMERCDLNMENYNDPEKELEK